MEKKVSIIMGIYNCAATLRESIESILAQTYTNWEFIICDDGSEDDSATIAAEYVKQYPGQFVLLKNEQNLGLNATLNRCLKVSHGKYIARQDGDDISRKDRLLKEVEFLDAHPEYAFVSTNMSYFDENGTWGELKNPPKPEKEDFYRHSPCFCHAPCMIRRKAFFEVKGYTVRNRYLRCEDINLWYKLYAMGYKGYNIQEPLYSMRDDKNAYKRRTVKNRINIIMTEWDGMRSLRCTIWDYRFFIKKAVRNIILAFMPEMMYQHLHQRRLNS